MYLLVILLLGIAQCARLSRNGEAHRGTVVDLADGAQWKWQGREGVVVMQRDTARHYVKDPKRIEEGEYKCRVYGDVDSTDLGSITISNVLLKPRSSNQEDIEYVYREKEEPSREPFLPILFSVFIVMIVFASGLLRKKPTMEPMPNIAALVLFASSWLTVFNAQHHGRSIMINLTITTIYLSTLMVYKVVKKE